MKSAGSDGNLPLAVVLHIAYTGYGVVRSLTSAGVPVIAFQKDLSPPEAHSKLCRQVVTFNDDNELLDKLVHVAKSCSVKPVLFITSDVYVEFFVANRAVLEENYLIHYPATDVVGLLLNKDRFLEYAQAHDLPCPRSFRVESLEGLQDSLKHMVFPAIVKPFSKTPAWLSAKLDKAYLVHDTNELLSLYSRVRHVEASLLVQEWIPGPDTHIEYCLTYFNDKSECLASFTGAKIRQWPVGTGSTASTRPTRNEFIETQTVELFSRLGYRGFGSVEYKKHEITGKYYIMEPTVGRPNQQSYVATANGLNMPLVAYNALTGLDVGQPRTVLGGPVYYIDEWGDIGSVLVHLRRGQNCLGDFIGLVNKRKEYRYYDRRDVGVFLHSCLKLVVFVLLRCARMTSALWKKARSR